MMRTLLKPWHVFAYYFSWLLFMGGGLLVSILSLPLLLWRTRPGVQRFMRAVQRDLFRVWTSWFFLSGVLRIRWNGFDRALLTRGTVYIATHPSVLDAPLLLSRLPDSICIAKPGIMRNPALGAAATLAGYVTGSDGVDMIRIVAGKINTGQSLLVFPEGTRTEQGAVLNPFKPGFAVIASRAAAPVRLIIIRATPGLVTRGRPWWRLPSTLPATIEFSLDREWRHDPEKSAATLTAEIEAHAHAMLRETP